MYLWDIESLKRDLIEDSLSEAESFKYFLWYAIGNSLSALRGTSGSAAQLGFILLLGPVISICGLIYCFRKNGGAEGEQFLKRYMSIAWVAGMRWSVMLVVPFLAVVVLLGGVKIVPMTVVPLGTALGIFILLGLLYLRIGKHIDEVRRNYRRSVVTPEYHRSEPLVI